MPEGKSKVFIEIVDKIRKMIDRLDLEPGDKIPSERELSERLHVGRSSVREALRALELLGLIETRRGEGTFLKDGRGNQLVQLLSTFILQDEKARRDVIETKHFIEMDCLRLVLQRNNEEKLLQFKKWAHTVSFSDREFFHRICQLADNYLFFRIWMILTDYYRAIHLEENGDREGYLNLIDALFRANEEEVLSSYKKLRNLC